MIIELNDERKLIAFRDEIFELNYHGYLEKVEILLDNGKLENTSRTRYS